jgi:hypothetical protein
MTPGLRLCTSVLWKANYAKIQDGALHANNATIQDLTLEASKERVSSRK